MAIFKDFNPVDHDRSLEDRRRHRQLVEKSIKENLGEILSHESIIGESKDKKFKIPIRGLKEYQFIYGKNTPGVGSGSGQEKRGDKIGSSEQSGKGSTGAGSEEGEDIYETEVTMEDIFNYIIEDLELPELDKKKFSEILSETSKKKLGYQRHGIRPRLAKKRTVIEKIKRKQGKKRALRESGLVEKLERFPFKEDDLRYYKVKMIKKRESNAVIFCIMDTSGSMDTTKKYLARSFFFVLSSFIRMKYVNVEIVFISHTTIAKVVNENDFFHRVESGGTYISSGYVEALRIIKEKYNPSLWNIYAFHASDGENWGEDNEKAVNFGNELCNISNMFGYIEIMPSFNTNGIKYRLIDGIKNSKFTAVTIREKEDLWKTLKELLKKEVRRDSKWSIQ